MLRTIKYWAIYDPLTKQILDGATTKSRALEKCPHDCAIVEMKGHYLSKTKRRVSTVNER